MIQDKLDEFTENQALVAGADSTNDIDFKQDRFMGIGSASLAVFVHTIVGAKVSVGDETYGVDVITAVDSAYTLPILVARRDFTNAEAAQFLLAGEPAIQLPLPQDLTVLRFVKLAFKANGTGPTWTVTAHLAPVTHGDATVAHPSGWTVQ